MMSWDCLNWCALLAESWCGRLWGRPRHLIFFLNLCRFRNFGICSPTSANFPKTGARLWSWLSLGTWGYLEWFGWRWATVWFWFSKRSRPAWFRRWSGPPPAPQRPRVACAGTWSRWSDRVGRTVAALGKLSPLKNSWGFQISGTLPVRSTWCRRVLSTGSRPCTKFGIRWW